MKPQKTAARPSGQLLASSLLLPLLALWCCGQLWGSRRVLLGMLLLIMTATAVVAIWLLLRMLAWCGAQVRDLYLRVLLFLVRRWLPPSAEVPPASRYAGRYVAGSVPRDEGSLGTSLV